MTRPQLPLMAATVFAICSILPLKAQTPESKIAGAVRDSTGVGVPGATVTATNQATKASQTATTGTDGAYSLAVPPGTYSVVATLSGFRRAAQTTDVSAGRTSELNFSLQPLLSEEVTVTAMKREETLLNVPFSIAAPTAEVLRTRGVEDIEAVAANVGGFTVQNLGPGQSQVAMRGVSAGQIVRDQPGVKEQVGVYLDESAISLSLFTPDIDLFDTSRVEVLRGPQGTLFGAGSLSGTVRYITNQPELNVTSATLEMAGSAVQGGGLGGNVKLAFNAPMGTGAAVRVAGYFNKLPGFIDSVQPDLSVEEDVNDGYRAGVRATFRISPNDRFAFTPRVMFQRTGMDGWNRIDEFNILANPFTTTRPTVTLGGRRQFTQLEEEYKDDFLLADLNFTHRLGDMLLTSVTSYIDRDVLVVRDATALTASITGGSIGLPELIYTLDAPLLDDTRAKTWSQELRVSAARDTFQWVVGGFFSKTNRDYGQDLPVNSFQELSGIPTQGLRAPRNSLYFSDLSYDLNQFALFGEGTVDITPDVSVTGGLRFYHFSEEKEQIFDGIFANDNTGSVLISQPGETDANGVAPRFIVTFKLREGANLNAQVSRGFRLGGINDPLNEPLCTPGDLSTFGGREAWQDETAWNYELGFKSRLPNGLGAFSASAYFMDIRDLQATVTAGSCSSRVVFNVPKSRAQGIDFEFDVAPHPNFDFAVSASVNDSELRSTLLSTDVSGGTSVVAGIEEGRRLPTVPKFQLAAAATFQREVWTGALGYLTATYQHIGSRLTQVGDDELGTLDLLSFGANTIGGPLTANVIRYDAELPGYDIMNVRAGLRRGAWDVSFFINNVTDERALLSFDRERGTRARIGYLTNQPRTFGVSQRFQF